MSSNDFKAGDRCQWVDSDTEEVTDGTIESVIPPKRMKANDWWNTSKYTEAEREEMVTYANVKWDDNSSETLDVEDLEPEDSQLEREFRTKAGEVLSEIYRKTLAASNLLSDAVKLSEEHGIPFDSPISFLSQSYFPKSLREKYEGISSALVYAVTDTTPEYGDPGWEHSAVC